MGTFFLNGEERDDGGVAKGDVFIAIKFVIFFFL